MRPRLIILCIAVSGLILVGVGATFAYLETPETSVSVQQASEPVGIDSTRSSLQQVSLPLAMLGGGVGQLTDGSHQLDDGAHQLSDGLRQARDGGQQLADGLGQLHGGVGLLGDGATQISGGVTEVVDRLTGFGAMQGDVVTQLTSVADVLGASPDPVSRNAAGQLRSLIEVLNTQGLGPDTLDQLSQLRAGAQQLAFELTDPAAQFTAGMALAADGSRQLRDGLVLLDDGGRALTDGTGMLVDGVGPVAGVVDGIAENVRSATDALPTTTVAAGHPVVVTAPRQWWPYAVIALGAVLLIAAVAVPRPGPGRPTGHRTRRPEHPHDVHIQTPANG
ncbi:hypothetical protein [Nocardia sp. NPDC051750]|uniref:hypothetical protein n=1 Tax=Nocardia sp. NPDC051750 TaxID=3364325 RepID=UPI0037903A5F